MIHDYIEGLQKELNSELTEQGKIILCSLPDQI